MQRHVWKTVQTYVQLSYFPHSLLTFDSPRERRAICWSEDLCSSGTCGSPLRPWFLVETFSSVELEGAPLENRYTVFDWLLWWKDRSDCLWRNKDTTRQIGQILYHYTIPRGHSFAQVWYMCFSWSWTFFNDFPDFFFLKAVTYFFDCIIIIIIIIIC